MKVVKSPLRFPGSKNRIASLVAVLLEKNLFVGSHLYEPFAGGAAISLNLLAHGFIRGATWVERDPLVFSFWKCLKERPEDLIERMMSRRVTLRAWQRLEHLRSVKKPSQSWDETLELGYAGLFFNRTCFSGIIGAGPIGGMSQRSTYKIDCRFNKIELRKTMRSTSRLLETVQIKFGDGIKFLDDLDVRARHSVVYIDPPYVSNGHKLYRYSFSHEQHAALSEIVLSLKVPWLLSYDNHTKIRTLYGSGQASFVNAYQSLKGSRFVDELLFLSDDFELPGKSEVRKIVGARSAEIRPI